MLFRSVFDSCTTEVQKLRSSIRIRGLSGLGKTRLVYEVVANLSTETQSKVVYIDVANGSPNLLQWLKHAIETGYEGILVVDNCSPTLHINLTDDVLRLDSKVSLITLDHNLEELSGPTKEFRLKPLTSDSIKQMLEPTFASKIKDLDRIAEFAQGFPQMAVLIAEARLANESDVGKLNNDELARKLIGDVTALELSILKACSLFDRFGFDAEVSDQYQFIAENIIGTPIADCIRCLRKFEKRGLIDLSGRYAQVVPKPLAVKLAAEWWSESTSESLSKLVDLVPDKLVKPFCTQITMLSFLPEVQQLTESLCGVSRPFGKAEVILSERGSLLFRSFVEVNPVVTVNSLYQVLTSQNFEQLQSIKDNVRRNLVWALEKLAYHSSAFEQAAWCLLLLASAENEDWSNNATGQFEQLFGVWLSGTEANFQLRLSVLKRAADLNDNLIDSLIVKAAAHAISTHSGTRTVGAEYQGNKPPLEEYRPKIWQEIFDYWDACMTALLNIVKKASPNSLNAQKIIGHSIRGLLSNGRIEMLENAIKNIIDLNGRYWPSALESVGNAVEYDAEAMPEEGKAALQKWHKMLQPDVADLRERLKIIVIDPPWEYKKVESGHYVDISAANAKNLAIELSASTVLDEQLLELLLNGQQTQTFVFGRQWAIESKNVNDLIENIILKITSSSNLNLNFLLGLLSGLHHVNPKAWESYLNRFANSSELVKYFPEILRTGKITPHHLAKFLELITSGILDSNSATSLSYGSVTAHLKSDTMSDFCTKLALHNEQSNWPALDVLFMYCFAEGKFEECSGALKFIVVNTPLEKKNRSRHSDIYHWKEVVDKFILIEDFEFCQSIFRQILSASKSKIDFDDLIHSVKPTLVKIFSLFGDQLWGELGDALLKAKGRELWGVSQLIERDNSFSIQNPSILNFISIPTLIKWCQSNIESGPYLLARSINIFDMNENDVKEPNPIFIALLENFGGLKNLGSEFTANLSSKGWSGSLVPYLQSDKAALAPLLNHENFEVRTWAKNHFEYVDKVITYESIRDDENQAGIY